jgi:hypothetical protein
LEDCQSHQGRPGPSEKNRAVTQRYIEITRRSFGSLEAAEFIGTQLQAEGDALDTPERWPRFDLHANGEVKLAAYAPVPPAMRTFDALFRV